MGFIGIVMGESPLLLFDCGKVEFGVIGEPFVVTLCAGECAVGIEGVGARGLSCEVSPKELFGNVSLRVVDEGFGKEGCAVVIELHFCF